MMMMIYRDRRSYLFMKNVNLWMRYKMGYVLELIVIFMASFFF